MKAINSFGNTARSNDSWYGDLDYRSEDKPLSDERKSTVDLYVGCLPDLLLGKSLPQFLIELPFVV